MGKAPAITRRESSATVYSTAEGSIVRSLGVKLSLRAYAPSMRVQRLGRWVSSFLAIMIVLTGKAKNVLVIANCMFGAIDYDKFEKYKPVPY